MVMGVVDRARHLGSGWSVTRVGGGSASRDERPRLDESRGRGDGGQEVSHRSVGGEAGLNGLHGRVLRTGQGKSRWMVRESHIVRAESGSSHRAALACFVASE